MAIAMTMQQYLDEHGVTYDVLTHPKTLTSSQTAQTTRIPGDCLAKGVVLKGRDGYLLAVLPASHHLRMGKTRRLARRPLILADEEEVGLLFPDCETGAVPAIGTAYGLDTIVDERLEEQKDIYFDGGDHRTLVHISGEQFRRLMADAPHGRVSEHD